MSVPSQWATIASVAVFIFDWGARNLAEVRFPQLGRSWVSGMKERLSDDHMDSEQELLSSFNPVLVKESCAPKGCLECTRCGAQYYLKHWHSFNQSLLQPQPIELRKTLCPGCFRVANNIWHGTVVLQGDLLVFHSQELMALVQRVSHECWLDNPTSRLYAVIAQNDRIQMKTTTEWLATRIGKALRKAYKGSLVVKGSPDRRTVDVIWHSP